MLKKDFLNKHLKNIDESYFTHMRHALYFSVKSFGAGFILLLHSIAPFVLITNGSSIITRLYNIMTVRNQVIRLSAVKDKNVAIVGFGLSGLLAFLNLVKHHKKHSQKLEITIFEKSRFYCKGTAYSTKNINHLLNVPAYRMGVIDQDREHFYKWLTSKGYNYSKNDFVPRQIFGVYLEDVLESALKIADKKGISYKFINKEISEIGIKSNHYVINHSAYNHCILSTGVRLKNWDKNFWKVNLTEYLNKHEVHLIGCGLTAFDAAISLRDLNFKGTIFMHSRTGKMPQMHQIPAPGAKVEPVLTLQDASLPLSQIFKKFANACKHSPNWRLHFDTLRPMTQDFWKALTVEKKKRFMRHCFRLWNVHRHRCPESQYQIINEMFKAKKLIFSKKKPNEKNVIDCTGFDYGFKSHLVDSLLKNEIVEFDELKAGIISQKPNFHIMGGLNFGNTFEITAVPDIASQAHKVARSILN